MIKSKELNTAFAKNKPLGKGALGNNYKIKKHSLLKRERDDECRYTLSYLFSVSVFNDENKTFIEVETSGYFIIGKSLYDLTELDLYKCIQVANEEIETFTKKHGMFPNAILIPPNFEEMKPVLKSLLDKRPH